MVANSAGNASNKEREELVDVGDRTSTDQVETNVSWSVDTNIPGGGQGTCAGDGEGGGGDGTNGSGFINSGTAGVIQVHLLAYFKVVVSQSYNNRGGTTLGISAGASSCGIDENVVVFAVTQPDLINVSAADRCVRQCSVNIKDLGGVTNGRWNQAGCKQLTRSNS